MSRAKLYAARITKRAITIMDVPEDMQDAVMALLSPAEQRRQMALMEGR